MFLFEMVNNTIVNRRGKVTDFTAVRQFTLVMLLCHVVHQLVLSLEALCADATPCVPIVHLQVEIFVMVISLLLCIKILSTVVATKLVIWINTIEVKFEMSIEG